MKFRYIIALIVFGLLISTGFAATIAVPYMNHPTLDGVLDIGDGIEHEWENSAVLQLKNSTGTMIALVYFLQDGENLCIGWIATDSSYSIYDQFKATINGETLYVARGSPGTSSNAFGWKGEKCILYGHIGIVEGQTSSVYGSFEMQDYHMPNFDGTGSTTLTSESYWNECPGWYECCIDSECNAGYFCAVQGICAHIGECAGNWECEANEQCGTDWYCEPKPGYCTTNNNCAADEYCLLASSPANNKCTKLSCQSYEEVSNHECVLKAGSCYSNTDCTAGKYCSGNLCLVNTSCQFECCSNSECSDTKYCNGNACVNVPTGDCGYVSNHLWKEYECCADDDCENDEECSNHECIQKDECNGKINLKFSYIESSGKTKATVSGLDNCDGKIITIREISCAGSIVCSVESGDAGGFCTFNTPTTAGTYYYYACSDLDGDGDKESDSEGLLITVNCTSTGCMPSNWTDCVCPEGKTNGTKSGTCVDNCGKTSEYEQACACTLPVKSQEQIDAESAIQDAEDKIADAKEEDLDTNKSEDKLEQAQTAYDGGQYTLAKELAEEANGLVPEKEENPDDKKDWIADNRDLVMYGAIGIVVVIVLFLILRHVTTGSGGTPKPPEDEDNVQ